MENPNQPNLVCVVLVDDWLIGILLFWLVLAANFVLCIIAAIAASKGTAYRYPFALRLIK